MTRSPFIYSRARSRWQQLIFFSSDPAVFPDLDYARLKRSFVYFVEHYAPAALITPVSHSVKQLERDEPSPMSRAHRALAVAIVDFVEGTQDFCAKRVSEIDRDLQKRDAYTLSFLREVFTMRRDKI